MGCTKGVSTNFIIVFRKVFPESLWNATTLYLFTGNITSKTPLQEWLKYDVRVTSKDSIVEKEDCKTMSKDDTPRSFIRVGFFLKEIVPVR